jgi:hypothetical protein
MSKTVEKKVQPIRVKLMCDCGCEMEYTGMMLSTVPLQYLHKCPKCGHQEAFVNKIYPYIDFKEID